VALLQWARLLLWQHQVVVVDQQVQQVQLDQGNSTSLETPTHWVGVLFCQKMIFSSTMLLV
jgi:hypothetical protein